MINIEIIDMKVLIAFWLAFSRWSAIVMQMPLFDNSTIPVVLKILTTLLFTYAFFPMVEASILTDINYMGVDSFWSLTAFYTLVGVVLGFFVKAIMSIFLGAGSVITQQIGFSAIRYFDTTAKAQIGPFEKLISWTVLIMVVKSGALLPMFKGVVHSFETIHIYDFTRLSGSSAFYVNFFKNMFHSTLLLASPLIFSNVLIMAVLGIIAKTIPQMNVLTVSFVVNIGLGLIIFSATSDEFFNIAYRIYVERLGEWFQFIK